MEKETIIKKIREALAIVNKVPELTTDNLQFPYHVAAFEVVLKYLLEQETKKLKSQPAKIEEKASGETISQRVMELSMDDFYKIPKSAPETRDELKNRGYHHSLVSVSVALLTLVRKKKIKKDFRNQGR